MSLPLIDRWWSLQCTVFSVIPASGKSSLLLDPHTLTPSSILSDVHYPTPDAPSPLIRPLAADAPPSTASVFSVTPYHNKQYLTVCKILTHVTQRIYCRGGLASRSWDWCNGVGSAVQSASRHDVEIGILAYWRWEWRGGAEPKQQCDYPPGKTVQNYVSCMQFKKSSCNCR